MGGIAGGSLNVEDGEGAEQEADGGNGGGQVDDAEGFLVVFLELELLELVLLLFV